MNALICVDPPPDDEYDACLQIASFAVAALASAGYAGRLQRVALLASPAAALEILLAAWDATDRATVEGGERRRSPLVLLPPIVPRSVDEREGREVERDPEDVLRPLEDVPWSGTLGDLERAGVIERDARFEGEGLGAVVRFARGEAEELVRAELARHEPGTILVLGARWSVLRALRGRRGVIAYGRDAREMRGEFGGDALWVEDAAPSDSPDELGDELMADGEAREAAQQGARLGAQISHVLEALYLLNPDRGDERARERR